jgi:hypothetical protein
MLIKSLDSQFGILLSEQADITGVSGAHRAAGKTIFIIEGHSHAQLTCFFQSCTVDGKVFFAQVLRTKAFAERKYPESSVFAQVSRFLHLFVNGVNRHFGIVPEPERSGPELHRRVGKITLHIRMGGDARQLKDAKENANNAISTLP